MNKFLSLIISVFSLVLLGRLLLTPPSLPKAQETRPNIIVVMTDDQRWDTLCQVPGDHDEICSLPVEEHPMPTVEAQFLQGMRFDNTFVTDPLCCPVRASFLSGGYFLHNTNVISNNTPNGGVGQFIDTDTLATRLQSSGYKTAIIGKYLNRYGELVDGVAGTGYVPPGWDNFTVSPSQKDWNNNYEFVVGSSTPDASSSGTLVTVTDGTYITDYERDRALEFIEATCPSGSCTNPFFLLITPEAPHTPATVAPRHEALFSDYVYNDRGWGEQPDGDLSDKPYWAQSVAATWDPVIFEENHRNQLRTLRAVDEMLAAIIDDLEAKGITDNTYIVFTSDNGNMWGEHKLDLKSKAYEESIRVPLVIRGPTVLPGVINTNLVTADVDLPATILDWTGLNTIANDGISLIFTLSNPSSPTRKGFLIEDYDNLNKDESMPTWAGVRTSEGWKYIEYVTGEKELYDLVTDPFELTSLHANPDYTNEMDILVRKLNDLKRGTAIKTDNFPDPQFKNLLAATVGVEYSFQLTAWGGNKSYKWSIYKDGVKCLSGLGNSLKLRRSGLVTGTPEKAGTFEFCVKVEDTSISTQPGNTRPQFHIQRFKLTIN